MRPLVVIVPGLERPRWPRPFSYLLDLYVWLFKLNAGKRSWIQFAEYLHLQGLEAVVVEPVYWFSHSTISAAGKELAQVINRHNDAMVLFGYSLGASVIEAALPQCSDASHIVKIFSIAAPHSSNIFRTASSVPLINIYSNDDKYLSFSNLMLYRSNYKRLINAQNIEMGGMTHSAFASPDVHDFYLQKILH
jgi:predicted alpha/beta hydrolase family esterase